MTLQHMMMHHNTKFGNKMFGGLEFENKMFGDLEYTIWTNINILTLCCDLDRDFFFSQDTLVYDDVP